MIEMINQLIKKGFAYENNNHVYFEVKKFSIIYLSNKKLEDWIAGSRVEVWQQKNSEDFVLWNHLLDEPRFPKSGQTIIVALRMLSNVKKFLEMNFISMEVELIWYFHIMKMR